MAHNDSQPWDKKKAPLSYFLVASPLSLELS